MDEETPSYRKSFLTSPHHIVMGLATLGLGFMSADLLPQFAGATAYELGWMFLPDLPFYRGSTGSQHDAAKRVAAMAQVTEFVKKRDALLATLSSNRRKRYDVLADVCRDIEAASAESPMASAEPATDPRLRKLDELMWTFLRLLGIEESLDRFLETERREDLPGVVREAEAEVTRLSTEIDALKAKGPGATLDTKQRYLNSRLERLDVLHKRQQRIEQARDNLSLVVSEQERLDQQIKLIRADAVATKNAEALTARIDATVEHLDQTNKWLSELDEFKDLVADMPATEMRVGYAVSAPPPLPEPARGVRPQVKQR